METLILGTMHKLLKSRWGENFRRRPFGSKIFDVKLPGQNIKIFGKTKVLDQDMSLRDLILDI